MDYYSKFQVIMTKYDYTYKIIAEITGLSVGNVKNSLCSTGKFPNWLKLFVHHTEKIEMGIKLKEIVKEHDIKAQVFFKKAKALTTKEIADMVKNNKPKK